MIRLFILLITIVYSLYPRIIFMLPLNEVNDDARLTGRKAKIAQAVHKILLQHNSYYRKLSNQGRTKFMGRILYLMPKKRFLGYHDLKVTFEMRVVVLSALVQLTYGYRRFSLSGVKRIILYPQQFYSNYFKSDLKGLTGNDFVTLSWDDTLKGFQDEDDNLNLAIHEFSHALVLNYHKNRNDDWALANLHAEKDKEILRHFNIHRNSEHPSPYLREYALANKHEFLAVAIEHFFETPMEFQSRLPLLYRDLMELLRQDPLNVTNDYLYEK